MTTIYCQYIQIARQIDEFLKQDIFLAKSLHSIEETRQIDEFCKSLTCR